MCIGQKRLFCVAITTKRRLWFLGCDPEINIMRSEIKFVAGLVLFAVTIVGMSLLTGVLRLTGHEGDMMHAIDAALRMVDGQRQHIDYMTPLGVLATAPLALFLGLGAGPGMSMLLAQALMCVAFLPLIVLALRGRMTGGLRFVFAAAMVLMVTSLAFGGDNPSTSLAMYYNRWAWVAAALIVVVLMIRPDRQSLATDALVLGFSVACLALLKVTYLIGLLPFALVAILHDRAWKLFAVSLLVLLIALAAATLAFGGIEFWRAYAWDLLATMVSPVRSNPGEDFGSLLGKPAHLPASMATLVAVVYWRKTGRLREGLLLLLLFPGLVYVTYQNWGNDPVWLFLVAILLLAIPTPDAAREFWGIGARAFGRVLALVFLVIYAPSMINIATSVPRHLGHAASDFAPLFPDPAHDDLQVRRATQNTPRVSIPLRGVAFAETDEDDEPAPPVTLNGEVLEECDLSTGLVGWLMQISKDIEDTGLADGKQVMLADILDPLWMFGPFERVEHGAPWYYGVDEGLETVDMVAVPLCPLSPISRRHKLAAIEDDGLSLVEVARTEMVILLRLAR